MGVAGVALLFLIVFLYRSIRAVVVFLAWKSKINTTGTVKNLKDTRAHYSNNRARKITSVDFVYEMQIVEEGKCYTVEYIEKVAGDNLSKVQVNETLPVYFDLNKMQVRAARDLKKELWQNPLGILICCAVIALCFYITTLL